MRSGSIPTAGELAGLLVYNGLVDSNTFLVVPIPGYYILPLISVHSAKVTPGDKESLDVMRRK